MENGDSVVPQAGLVALSSGKTYLCKSFDDRVGLALMIQKLEALKMGGHPNTVCGCAPVVKAVGVPGIQHVFDSY